MKTKKQLIKEIASLESEIVKLRLGRRRRDIIIVRLKESIRQLEEHAADSILAQLEAGETVFIKTP